MHSCELLRWALVGATLVVARAAGGHKACPYAAAYRVKMQQIKGK